MGHTGLAGAMAIILLGHMVTIPTALALSEIATNRKVEGGGEYYIISRSFGLRIGAAIGVSLFLSQAVSISFFCISFAESFRPLAPWFESTLGVPFDPRFISIPFAVAVFALMVKKGADLGITALYVVGAVLAVSLILFFLGKPVEGHEGGLMLTDHIEEPDPFFVVFAICFPAFTGVTAGVGLSGDLKDPSRSIPRGTMLGTAVGLVVYTAVVWKLAASVPAERLATDQQVMSDIAL